MIYSRFHLLGGRRQFAGGLINTPRRVSIKGRSHCVRMGHIPGVCHRRHESVFRTVGGHQEVWIEFVLTANVDFEAFRFARSVIAQGAEMLERALVHVPNVLGKIIRPGEILSTFLARVRLVERVSERVPLHRVVTVERAFATVTLLAHARYARPVWRVNDGVPLEFIRPSKALAALLAKVLALFFRGVLRRFRVYLRQEVKAVFVSHVQAQVAEAQELARAVFAAEHLIGTPLLVRQELDGSREARFAFLALLPSL